MNQPEISTEEGYNYALTVEYRGTHFAGFQFQKDARSVQEELERALGIFLREPITIHVSGRTDSGVHATGQVVGFVTKKPVTDFYRLVHSTNAILPADVAIARASPMPSWFHVRFSCIAREYEYLIWNGRHRSTHRDGRALWLRDMVTPAMIEEINKDLSGLIGHHDFVSFTRLEYAEETTHRYVDLAELRVLEDGLGGNGQLLSFRIRGNAFLHNMIRIIVGSMVDRIRGKIGYSLQEILQKKDRNFAGHTVSPVGLYFRQAYYSEEIQGLGHLHVLPDYPVFARRAIPQYDVATTEDTTFPGDP